MDDSLQVGTLVRVVLIRTGEVFGLCRVAKVTARLIFVEHLEHGRSFFYGSQKRFDRATREEWTHRRTPRLRLEKSPIQG